MFCTKCGKEINDQAVICVHCGCLVNNANQGGYTPVPNAPAAAKTDEKPTLANCSVGFAFLIPIVGFILGIIGAVKYQTDKYKKQSIIAIPLSIVSWIIYSAVYSILIY